MRTSALFPTRCSDQRGSTLMVLMIVMFFLVTAGAALAALQLRNSQALWVNHDANQAYYLAEAGIEDGLARWRTLDKGVPGDHPFQGTVKDFQNQIVGSYEATVSIRATDSLIVSHGVLSRDPSFDSTHSETLDNLDGHVVDWRQQ